MTDPRINAVERFYDFHPINAKQILAAVVARGIAPDAITEAVLQQHDQDHYGGTAATDRLITEAAVRAEDVVLDVCTGMGGPLASGATQPRPVARCEARPFALNRRCTGAYALVDSTCSLACPGALPSYVSWLVIGAPLPAVRRRAFRYRHCGSRLTERFARALASRHRHAILDAEAAWRGL